MKTKTVWLAIALTLPLQIFAAANATTIANAQELIEILNITKSIDSSFAEIAKFSTQIIDSQDLSAEEKTRAKRYMSISMDPTFEEMKNVDWNKMFAEVYAEIFTAEEIDGLIKFYKSPLGQKLLAEEPQLTKATMAKMQVEMAKIMPKLRANMTKAIKDSKKTSVVK
jgi:hypothetical protein